MQMTEWWQLTAAKVWCGLAWQAISLCLPTTMLNADAPAQNTTTILMTDAPAQDLTTMLMTDASHDHHVDDWCTSTGHKQQKPDVEQLQTNDVRQLSDLLA